MSGLREECGLFGVYSPEKSDLAKTTYYGLFALQHRGQENCGIVMTTVFLRHIRIPVW